MASRSAKSKNRFGGNLEPAWQLCCFPAPFYSILFFFFFIFFHDWKTKIRSITCFLVYKRKRFRFGPKWNKIFMLTRPPNTQGRKHQKVGTSTTVFVLGKKYPMLPQANWNIHLFKISIHEPKPSQITVNQNLFLSTIKFIHTLY